MFISQAAFVRNDNVNSHPDGQLSTFNFQFSQRHSRLEYGYLAVVLLLIVHLFTAGHTDDVVDEALEGGAHGLILDDDASVEVDPRRLILGKRAVGRYLHGGDEGAERRAASCGEEHDVASTGSEGC